MSKELIERLRAKKEELGYYSIERMLHEMLDMYEIADGNSLHIFHTQLRSRMRKGVGGEMISEMRTLYTYLGHVLQRIRAL